MSCYIFFCKAFYRRRKLNKRVIQRSKAQQRFAT